MFVDWFKNVSAIFVDVYEIYATLGKLTISRNAIDSVNMDVVITTTTEMYTASESVGSRAQLKSTLILPDCQSKQNFLNHLVIYSDHFYFYLLYNKWF